MGIKVLDCTLRDGSYIVGENWGETRILDISNTLTTAGVDIIECGWLKNQKHSNGSVFYNQPSEMNFKIRNAALMLDQGKYDIDKLDINNGSIDIIRIAFYKDDLDKISFSAEKIKDKGYKVFLQASNTIEYSEKELDKLCKRANFIGVNSVYIVDSFGSMFPEDLDKIINIFNNTVNTEIEIGFHSHNNIQLSLALSIHFINEMQNRDIIIDSSLCGIGRSIGNTQTELLLEYLNKKKNMNYNTSCIWDGIKKNIEPLYEKYSWKYTPLNAYKGIHGLHPNINLDNYTI